jgi:transcriptional regulator with XRE-family HTH domain
VKERENTPGLADFATEVRAFRQKAGLTQEALAAKLGYSLALVSMVEGQRRAPTLQFAERCDEVFGTPGSFVRLYQRTRKDGLPAWFQPWADREGTAAQLRFWEPLVINGLLQTADYARALLATRPNTPQDELDQLVTARIQRQAVLDRPNPPMVWVIMDETALQREVGGPDVMRDQLRHLAELALRPNITVEVVQFSGGAHSGLNAPFNIAESDDGTRAGYLETTIDGYIIQSHAAVADLMLIFDTLRSQALTRKASHELILKWAGGYDDQPA